MRPHPEAGTLQAPPSWLPRRGIRCSALSLLLLVLCCLAAPAALAANLEPGLQAFRAGDLERALDHFEALRAEGLDIPQLHYNLGVTYYRLGRYREAETAFSRILDHTEWGALAHYNLGRVAERLDEPRSARHHYRRALEQTTDERLHSLARGALEGLEIPPARDGRVMFLGGVGYDDNVTLEGEADQLGVSRENDLFVDALVAGELQIDGHRRDGWRLSGAGYLRRHLDVGEFDFTTFRTGIWRDRPAGDWRLTSGGFVDFAFLDGDRFTTTLAGLSRGTYELGRRGRLILSGQLGHVNGGPGFDSFTGQQHRGIVEWRGRYGGTDLRLGYELEYNDRRDLEQGDEFFSRSPIRHTLRARGDFRVDADWWMIPEIAYRHSRYQDADRREIDGELRSDRRTDERWLIRLRAERSLDRGWLFFAEYEHTDADDTTFAEDAYTRNVVMVGVEYFR